MSQIKKESIKKEDNEEKLKIDLSENELIIKYIEDIKKDRNRINAIKQLSKYSEKNSLLSIYLWYSTGVIAAILQEIINYYQYFSLLKLTQEKSNELCAAISLFKCVASNVETRDKFIDSQLPIFLYPFLSNTSKSKPYEYVKLTTLSLFGALVNDNNSKIISYLTGKEIIPLCLRIIERGTELSKFTASFILLRITNNESGFNYICENKNRFYIIIRVLSIALKGKLSSRIVKFFFKIFARLSENKKIRTILKTVLQEEIKGQNYYENLDDSSKDSFKKRFN
jgi:CCR4-NOT transcription complex subunit 9